MIENLLDAGCFDFTGWSRDALRQSVEPMFETAVKEQKEAAVGVLSLFSLMGDTSEDHFSKPPEVKIKSSKLDTLLKEKELLGFFLTGHPMDSYKNILGRLSCFPLRRVESMDHNTVFRSGIIVESVAVRFSSKTKRKFAILMISDGIESYELPIWPDLYEEKHFLLRENQLIYAVLQVDNSEGATRLSCRWLDDLTKATDAMIAECDRAYDKAKHQAARYAQTKKNGGSKRKVTNQSKSTKPVAPKKLSITLDAELTKLSHILKLKEIFSNNRGKSVVQIDFAVGGKAIAALHIDDPWGVDLSSQLQNKLKDFPFVLSVQPKVITP